jgi:hypothetical protein
LWVWATSRSLFVVLPLSHFFLNSSEKHTIRAREARRITAAEMKHARKTAGYTWTDYEANTEIEKGIKYDPRFGQNAGIRKKLDSANS